MCLLPEFGTHSRRKMTPDRKKRRETAAGSAPPPEGQTSAQAIWELQRARAAHKQTESQKKKMKEAEGKRESWSCGSWSRGDSGEAKAAATLLVLERGRGVPALWNQSGAPLQQVVQTASAEGGKESIIHDTPSHLL